MKIVMTLILVFAPILGLPACGPEGDDGPIAGRTVRTVATTGMVADAVRIVGGDRVAVDALMGPGVDPHLYKATEGDVNRMTGADVIFYNGLHLEGRITEVLERIEGRGPKSVAVAEAVPEERLLSSSDYANVHDPHVWFDVSLWMHVVESVRDALVKIDPDHRKGYEARARAYLDELSALHDEVKARAAEIPEAQRVLITAHDAFNYFGRAYGFEVRGLQGISTATEAGTGDVKALAGFIAERKIPALFVEASVPKRSIEAVQAAVKTRGFEVSIGGELFSDSMGDPGTDEGTYQGMVRHNIETIATALKPR